MGGEVVPRPGRRKRVGSRLLVVFGQFFSSLPSSRSAVSSLSSEIHLSVLWCYTPAPLTRSYLNGTLSVRDIVVTACCYLSAICHLNLLPLGGPATWAYRHVITRNIL